MAATHTDSYWPARRRYKRKSCAGKAFIFHEGETNLSKAVEISQGGMLIATTAQLTVGSQVSIHFFLQKHYIRAKGEVIYLLPDEMAKTQGKVGVRFASISDSDIEFIKNFTSQIDP
jgi:c-di-GMP-binding flagellar brake protein YcgR